MPMALITCQRWPQFKCWGGSKSCQLTKAFVRYHL